MEDVPGFVPPILIWPKDIEAASGSIRCIDCRHSTHPAMAAHQLPPVPSVPWSLSPSIPAPKKLMLAAMTSEGVIAGQHRNVVTINGSTRA